MQHHARPALPFDLTLCFDEPLSACSGKTSLLFHFAFHLASKGQEVWMLCDQNALDQHPPFLPLSVDQTSDEALGRIKFK